MYAVVSYFVSFLIIFSLRRLLRNSRIFSMFLVKNKVSVGYYRESFDLSR